MSMIVLIRVVEVKTSTATVAADESGRFESFIGWATATAAGFG